MRAVDECGAPVVSIPGGEPLLHPEIDRIVEGLVARKKYVYLCTNAILLEEKLDLFTPSQYLTFSVHLDGDRETTTRPSAARASTTRPSRRSAPPWRAGFRVTTNTTLFDGADPDRIRALLRRDDGARRRGHDGLARLQLREGAGSGALPAPSSAPSDLFRRLLDRPGSAALALQPVAAVPRVPGRARELRLHAVGHARLLGLRLAAPCYLLQEGYAESFRELIEETEWARYGHASGNPECRDCMVHSGYEASAVEAAFSSPRGMWAMLRALLRGPRVPKAAGDCPRRVGPQRRRSRPRPAAGRRRPRPTPCASRSTTAATRR